VHPDAWESYITTLTSLTNQDITVEEAERILCKLKESQEYEECQGVRLAIDQYEAYLKVKK